MSFFKIYLHCTVILTPSTALPHSLLASHLYSPASLLLMLVNSSKLVLLRWPLATLIQNTVGWGVPDALQNRLVLWLSIKNWSSIDWMDAGTAIKLHKLLLCLAQKSKDFQGFCLKFKDFSRSGANHENCKHYSSMHCASDTNQLTLHMPLKSVSSNGKIRITHSTKQNLLVLITPCIRMQLLRFTQNVITL